MTTICIYNRIIVFSLIMLEEDKMKVMNKLKICKVLYFWIIKYCKYEYIQNWLLTQSKQKKKSSSEKIKYKNIK